nr:hypothetical protein [Tanacetum cinerariifolium]
VHLLHKGWGPTYPRLLVVIIVVVVMIVVVIGGYVNGFLLNLRFRDGNIPFSTLSQMVKLFFYLLDLSSGTILLYQKLLEFNPADKSNSSFSTFEIERLATHKLFQQHYQQLVARWQPES